MIVWRRNDMDPDEGCCVSWHATEREARAYEPAAGDAYECSVERVEIPNDREALLRWLNLPFSITVRDNG
jgi:hypothetical protein